LRFLAGEVEKHERRSKEGKITEKKASKMVKREPAILYKKRRNCRGFGVTDGGG